MMKKLTDFMQNQFYTGNPDIDSWLFVGLALAIFGPIFLLMQWRQERASDIKFEKDKARFWKEVEEGKKPDWAPRKVLPNGSTYTDPECLARTIMFKRQVQEVNEFFEKHKNERGEVETHF